jgi:hypothetical protein
MAGMEWLYGEQKELTTSSADRPDLAQRARKGEASL